MAAHFSRLCHLTGRHAASLTAFLRCSCSRDVRGLAVLEHAAVFLDAYMEYVHCPASGSTLLG